MRPEREGTERGHGRGGTEKGGGDGWTGPGAAVGEAEIRSALAAVDPDVPLFRLSTVELTEADIQVDLDRRRPGRNRHTAQRNGPDQVRILSGVFEGRTTGTPIGLIVENTDQRSRDYGDIKDKFRPGHADYTYHQKYGIRDYRGGGRSSSRAAATPFSGPLRLGLRCYLPLIWMVTGTERDTTS